jgi:tape measure domain-containing protein
VAGDDELEWDLRIDADTSGGTKMDAELGKVDRSAKAAAASMSSMEKDAERHMNRTGQHAESLEHKIRHEFGGVGHSIKYVQNELKDLAEFTGLALLAEGVIHVTEKIIELGEEMFKAAGHEERMGIAFRNALGGEEGEAAMGYIEKISHHTEFTKDQLLGINLELAKTGFHAGALAKATEAVLDLSSMSANPQEGASRAMGALERIKTTGKVDARTLRPFGIDQKTFFDELSKETGTGVAQLKKDIEKGKVDVDTTLNSLYTVITEKTGRALGGAGADMEHTFNVRLKNLKEIPDLLYGKLAKGPGFAAVSDFIGKIGDQFSLGGEQGKKIFTALTSEVDRFGNALAGVNIGDVGDTVADIIGFIGKMVAGTTVLIGSISSGFQKLRDAYTWLESLQPGERGRRATFELGSRKLDRAFHANPEYSRHDAEVSPEESFLKKPGTKKDVMGGMEKGGEGSAEATGEKIGHAVEKGARKALRSNSPSEAFADIGDDMAEGTMKGWDRSSDQIDRAIAAMAGGPAMGRGAGARGGGPIAVSIAPVIHVNGGGAGAEEIADSIVDKLNELVPGAMQSALEQLAMQGGSAT